MVKMEEGQAVQWRTPPRMVLQGCTQEDQKQAHMSHDYGRNSGIASKSIASCCY